MTTKITSPLDRLRARIQEPAVQPTGAPPTTVEGGLGVVRAAESEVPYNAPDVRPLKLSTKDAERLMLAELLQAVQTLAASNTELTAAIGRQGASNGVLDVFRARIPTAGYIQRDYSVSVGSVLVVNESDANAVTIVSAPASGTTPPATGVGVHVVTANAFLCMPVAGSRVVTIWGTAGDYVDVQVYTGLQPWGGGGPL